MQLLFAFGSNGSGQLGIGHKDDVSVPKPVLFSNLSSGSPPITKVAAGGNHTVLLTSTGTLHWSGDHKSGACGKITERQVNSPPQFHPVDLSSLITTNDSSSQPSDVKVLLIAATWETTIIATTSPSSPNAASRIYSFGIGNRGELGLGPFLFRTPTPSQIPNFPPLTSESSPVFIIDLSASMAHTVAVLSDGTAWGWGVGRHGQLGTPQEAVMNSPRKIEGVPFHVVRALCGKEFTCLFGASGSGDLVVLGSDKWGVKSTAPATADIAGWRDVGAGWGNVFVLKQDGKVLSWGRNDHGQMTPAKLGPAGMLAVGSEHVLALSEGGSDVTAWGWGEHGNCGPLGIGEEDKGQVVASTKHAPPGARVTLLGAGCATSWVALELQD